MSATGELERARLARDVLDNPVYQDAITQIEQEIISQWQAGKETKEREWYWTLLQAHKRLQLALKDTMQTGQWRSQQIEMQRNRLEKVGRILRGD